MWQMGMRHLLVFPGLKRLFFSRTLASDLSVSLQAPECEKQPTFSDLFQLPPLVVSNLDKQGLVYPTEIQNKVIQSCIILIHYHCSVLNWGHARSGTIPITFPYDVQCALL